MHIHILGVSGTMTTPIAVDLIRQGHTITGSDQDKIYPPFSTILSENNIIINQPFPQADQYIVGSSYKAFDRCRQELAEIEKNHLPYISATNYIAQKVIKQNSILVAGSYGKSTISALLTWILIENNFNPSYFFGAECLNKIPSLTTNQSSWSVVEADESINGLDTQAKFLYYPAKYLILTSTDWEHKDSYKTEADNLLAFEKLVKNLPSDGLLVYNQKSLSAVKLSKLSEARAIPYTSNRQFESSLIGQHNQENISAVFTLCSNLGISENKILSAIKSFQGLKRRLEIIPSGQDITIIDDFAQSPLRVKLVLSAIKKQFPNSQIYVYFEPHASFLQTKEGLLGFNDSFQFANKIFLGQIKYNPIISKQNRVIFKDYQAEIGDKLIYRPLEEDLYNHIISTLKPSDVLIHFSSGGLSGINLTQKIASFYLHK